VLIVVYYRQPGTTYSTFSLPKLGMFILASKQELTRLNQTSHCDS